MSAATQIPGYVVGIWDFDPVHSDVSFSVRHMMVSKVKGRFGQFAGTITTAEDVTGSVVTATLDASSIDTRSEQRDGHINPIHRREIEFPMLLPACAHGRNFLRQIALYYSVSMGQKVVGPFTGRNGNKLSGGGFDRRFRLRDGIGDQRMPDDVGHLVAKSIEPAEVIEHAISPQEVVPGRRQCVPVGAQFESFFGAMIVEIAFDEPILEHAAKSDARASRCPGDLARQREV